MKNSNGPTGFLRLSFLMALVLELSLLWPEVASAEGSLTDEIGRQVEVIVSAMAGATDIDLREFDCGSTYDVNGHIGPGLQAAFEAAFRAHGIVINVNADHVLSGQFFTTSKSMLAEKKPLRLTIKANLVKRDGENPVVLLPITAPLDAKHVASINDTKDLARALGFSGLISVEDDAKRRQEQMSKQILSSPVVINGSRIRSNTDSQYDVEVLKRQPGGQGEFTPVRPTFDAGLPFAAIGLNEEYELKILNRSRLPVAVAVAVDGLDVFQFADSNNRDLDGNPKYTHFIAHAKGDMVDGGQSDGTTIIAGWFQKLEEPDNYLSFLVTEFGKGAISQQSRAPRTHVGAIHLQFSHCKPWVAGMKASRGSETGFGAPRSIRQKAVRFEIDPPHEFITLRYNRK